MNLWMSAEYSGDIDDELRIASNFVETQINTEISKKKYNLELDSWDCIIILMEDNDYEEITKYSKKKKDMDFRLKIDYSSFISTNQKGREILIYNMLIRSLDILIEKGVSSSGIRKLQDDIESVAKKNEWI